MSAPTLAVPRDGEKPLMDGVSTADFALAFRQHAAGVAVITADAGEGPVALTATSVSSVSADPPLLMFSISARSSSAPTVRRAETVVVHLLGSDQVDIARLCATSGVNRFADVSSWRRLPTGEPHFPDAPVRIRGQVVERVDASTATVVIVHALETAVKDDLGPPLVYHDRTWHALGERSRLSE